MLHERLIEATGGSTGIRDEGMLDSALSNPFQSFGGEELYPSIQAKAAQLCFGLVKNHSMVDGNKRLGTHVMLVFFALWCSARCTYEAQECYQEEKRNRYRSLSVSGRLRWRMGRNLF